MANLGFGAAVMIGQETTWGTAVARTNAVRITDWGVKRNISKVSRPHLGTTSAVSMNRRQFFIESDEAGGPFSYLAAYDDSTVMLMAHALGAAATTGTGPYVHTLTLGKFPYTIDTNKVGLTLEGLQGDSGESEVFEGCLFTRTEFSLSAAEVATITHEVIAETSGGLVAAGTPTFSSNGEEILHSHGGDFTFNSTVDKFFDMTITIDQNLTRRQKVSSAVTQQPYPAGFISVTGSITIEYDRDDRHDEYLADTRGDAVITLTGTGNNQLVITLQNIVITDVGMPINSAGIIRQTVEFTAFSDGTDEGVKFAFTNDNSTFTAN